MPAPATRQAAGSPFEETVMTPRPHRLRSPFRPALAAALALVPACALALALAAAPARADDARPATDLSVDWIWSDEGKAATATPQIAWLEDGTALLYDERRPAAERTLERYVPETGRRTPLVDPAAALAAFEDREELGWPDALDPLGRRAVWTIDDALWTIELGADDARFRRLTDETATVVSPRFSPDGAKLAYVRDHDLWVWDVASDAHRRLTHDGDATTLNGTLTWVYWEEIFGRNDLGYWWAPDGASIAFFQTDVSPVGTMHYVDFKPALPDVIEQRYPKTGTANPKVRAGRVDLASGEIAWADLGRKPYEYLVRLNWLPDASGYLLQTLDRPQQTLDIWRVDARTGDAHHVLRETDPGWVNLHDDLYFVENGRKFLWASERTGYSHLYLYSIEGDELGAVTRGEWTLRSSGGGPFWLRQTVPHVDEEGGWIYYTSLEESPLEKHLYRVRLDGTGKERLTREAGTHGITFDPQGRYWFDRFSTRDALPVLRLHRADGSAVRDVSTPATDWTERFDLDTPELISIPAGDGFPLPAQVLRPKGFKKGKRYPVVLYVYGGPSAPTVADSWGGRNFWEHLLAREGFAAVRIDNRAATAIGKKYENAILRDGYGAVELTDLVEAVRWLKQQPWVDPQRVGIWGWSGGGSYTLLAMTRSEEFRAGIAVAAVSDWRYYDTIWAEAFMKTPQANPEGYERTSHVKRAGDLHGRLLLVHGTYDDNVHPQNAWAFADALIERGILFDMMIYPMRKHGIADDAAQKHLYKTMLAFWKRELAPPAR